MRIKEKQIPKNLEEIKKIYKKQNVYVKVKNNDEWFLINDVKSSNEIIVLDMFKNKKKIKFSDIEKVSL